MTGDLAFCILMITLILFAGIFGKGCENMVARRFYWARLWYGLAVASGGALAD